MAKNENNNKYSQMFPIIDEYVGVLHAVIKISFQCFQYVSENASLGGREPWETPQNLVKYTKPGVFQGV